MIHLHRKALPISSAQLVSAPNSLIVCQVMMGAYL